MTLGDDIKSARPASRPGQRELACKTGADRHYASDLERDAKRPSEAMPRKLAAALDETPEALPYGRRAGPSNLGPDMLENAARTVLDICAAIRARDIRTT